MLQNYLKITLRNLARNKTYSLLILTGLATGMTCAIALWLYVRDELSFDRYHPHADCIYRINLNIKWSENQFNMGISSSPFGPALQQEYPEIRKTLRVKKGSEIVRTENKAVNIKEIIYADSTLFSFFDYPFKAGNARTALVRPGHIVLTEKLALILFGKVSGVVGKTVIVKENIPLTVSAVISAVPANHHLAFEAILPYFNREVSAMDPDKWDSFNTMTYVMLDHPESVNGLTAKMPAFYKKYIAKTIGDNGESNVSFQISYQPLSDIHLRSTHLLGEENGSNMRYVYTFSVIGLFILLIAVVNYVNLATARSIGRAKEIGVRKAVGSQRFQLIAQFLAESVFMSFMALLLTIILLKVLLPFFNQIAGKTLAFDLTDFKMTGLVLGFTFITGLVSGFYPALILSRFKPETILKGSVSGAGNGAVLRKSLVVVQFAISMIMIMGTITVYRQLQFMRHKELGFNQHQVITLPLKGTFVQQTAEVLKSKLLQNPFIKNVSLTNGLIGENLNNKTSFSFYRKGAEQTVSSEYFYVDTEFLDVLKILVQQGRAFASGIDNENSSSVLVNEAMMKRLGWKDYKSGLIEIETRKVPVTGVISDFHLRSLHNQIEPLVLLIKKEKSDHLLIRVAGHNIPAAIDYIKDTFNKVNAGQPFEYAFLDQTFAKQYEADERKSSLFLAFSVIAIIIACLGLFGLATFTSEQRRKEIGVRKVLGASVASVVTLLSADFLKLVLIAIIISVPAGWYVMKTWLQSFAYKADLVWWIFALAGLLSVAVALLTISFQSVKAALMNPVKSLRTE
ncbi:ABC transporter permease [Dyadobacter sediminis]|uniref:FtsX-like permease family protein n=1 Tax=Dyadobacter sediminis TaxID=1493691 RepID=A0A5R9KJX4_9BACT|nr:ABC transporter permease [Dyadobacter sediminis]TLU96484.1 FtsX-like permease family protein [Dyadobacter sediminis]GGB82606.1 ABC transporter permease [Dyadobacter sediminis]